MFGEERVSKIKVHPDFDKFSEEVLHDIMFGSVFFFPSSQEKLIFLPILKEINPQKNFHLDLKSSEIYFTIQAIFKDFECHDVQHFLITIAIVSNHFRPFDFVPFSIPEKFEKQTIYFF